MNGERPSRVLHEVGYRRRQVHAKESSLNATTSEAKADGGSHSAAIGEWAKLAGHRLALTLQLILVLDSSFKLYELRSFVEGVAREEEVVTGLNAPCEEHEKSRVDAEGCGHGQRDHLGSLSAHVKGSSSNQAPVSHRSPEVGGLPAILWVQKGGPCRSQAKVRRHRSCASFVIQVYLKRVCLL